MAQPCAAGTYQNVTGQSECAACPASYYCEGEGTVQPQACPAGAWCPAESTLPYEHLCPNGTFSDALGLSSEAECTPCTPGFYCGEAGLTAPSGECSSGHYCGGRATTRLPATTSSTGTYVGDTCVDRTEGGANDICPPGKL